MNITGSLIKMAWRNSLRDYQLEIAYSCDFPRADLKADVVVAKDGSGNYLSIADAVDDVPSNLRNKKYVKAGLYNETVRVSQSNTNIMLVGDGQGKTVVVSNRNLKMALLLLVLQPLVLFQTLVL